MVCSRRRARSGQKQDQQDPQKDTVSEGDGTDYAAQLKAKDAEIEALQAKVAEAAKTAEATERLGKEIVDLKARLADERTEFTVNGKFFYRRCGKDFCRSHGRHYFLIRGRENFLPSGNSSFHAPQ